MASFRPSENFNIGHNFFTFEDSNLIFGMHVYLMELHILSGERSRSSFKVKCQIYGVCPSENFNIGHNFFNIEDSNLIFGMHVHLTELHILSGER